MTASGGPRPRVSDVASREPREGSTAHADAPSVRDRRPRAGANYRGLAHLSMELVQRAATRSPIQRVILRSPAPTRARKRPLPATSLPRSPREGPEGPFLRARLESWASEGTSLVYFCRFPKALRPRHIPATATPLPRRSKVPGSGTAALTRVVAFKIASPEEAAPVTVITSVKEKSPLKASSGLEHVDEKETGATLEPLQMSVPFPNSVLLVSAKKLQLVVARSWMPLIEAVQLRLDPLKPVSESWNVGSPEPTVKCRARSEGLGPADPVAASVPSVF